MKRILFFAFHFFISVLATSCGDNVVSDKYCSLPAHFLFTPVNSIPQLYTSCNSMGEWCTITIFTKDIDGHPWVHASFANPQGSTPWPLSKMDSYRGVDPGLSGFIVGLPNIPELGETVSVVTCYDLACRNCHEETDYMAHPLTLQEGGYARCSRCRRTYNLNNVGQVDQGDAGKPLYRYRVYYGNNTLSVDNR